MSELPQAIAELSNLTVLSVSNNQLSVLPSNIKHLKERRRLYLNSSQLTTLPDDIGELKELEWLDVCKSKLTVLSPHIKHLNKLRVLLLSEDQLTTLSDDIGELKKLGWLYVERNEKGCENTEDEVFTDVLAPEICFEIKLSEFCFQQS